MNTAGLKLSKHLPDHQIKRVPIQNSVTTPPNFIAKTTSKVVDQGCCGSCYAVVLTQVMEDRYNQLAAEPVTLSYTDILTDTTFPEIFMQCQGGYIAGERVEAFMYAHGLTINGSEYPQCLRQCNMQNCNLTPDVAGYRVNANEWIETTHINEIKALIFESGPVAAGFGCMESMLESSHSWAQLKAPLTVGAHTFKSACVATVQDVQKFSSAPFFHAVSVVGWVTLSNNDFVKQQSNLGGLYWVIRNSWGLQWGFNGFALLPSHTVNPTKLFAPHPYMFDNGITSSDYELPQVAAPRNFDVIEAEKAEIVMEKFKKAIQEKIEFQNTSVGRDTEDDKDQIFNNLQKTSSYFVPVLAAVLVGIFLVFLLLNLLPKWLAS